MSPLVASQVILVASQVIRHYWLTAYCGTRADDVLNNVVNTVVGPAATATSLGLPAAGSVPVNLNLLGAQFLNFMVGDLHDSTVSNYNVSCSALKENVEWSHSLFEVRYRLHPMFCIVH